MNKRYSLLLLLPSIAHGQQDEGFAEVRGQAYLGVDGQAWSLVERLRPSFTIKLGDRTTLTSTVELNLHQGRDSQEELERLIDEAGLTSTLQASGYNFPPEEANPTLDVSEAADYLRVERLYFDAYLPRLDLRLGRQALNWGSALLVNPTDPFPEVLLTEPWRPRSGVNALRVSLPLADRSQVQLVVGSSDDFTEARLAGRATLNLGLADLSAVAAWRPEVDDALVGLDTRGTLGVGYWLEGAYHLNLEAEEENYLDAAVGIDYSFPLLQTLAASIQYYFNGAGEAEQSSSPANSLLTPPSEPADPFAQVFHGRHYGMVALNLGVTREISASLLWIQNLGDGSASVIPVLVTYPTGWLEISASAQLPLNTWGDSGEFNPSDDDLKLVVPSENGLVELDLNGLAPDAIITVWSRINF